MHTAIQKIVQFKSELKLESIYNLVVIIIIFVILFLASTALYRPISMQQFENIRQLSTQAQYPDTQNMATVLKQKSPISYGQYLKLMQAYQLESRRARQLTPFQAD